MDSGEESAGPQSWRLGGEQVRLWRERAGITREELGRLAGYEADAIEAMETGLRRPTKRLLAIADEAFGAGGFLMAGDKFMPPDPHAPRVLPE